MGGAALPRDAESESVDEDGGDVSPRVKHAVHSYSIRVVGVEDEVRVVPKREGADLGNLRHHFAARRPERGVRSEPTHRVLELAASAWSAGFGMLTDRFGVTWVLDVAG